MKKKYILFGLFLILIFTSAFSAKEWRESIYEQIKTETIKGLKDAFNTDISVRKVEGIIVGQVVFEDVVIPDIASAKKVYVNFNPLKFAYYQDVVPAISKITIVDGEFNVVRDKADHLNVLSLLPPEEPGAPPPPPFLAKLIFKNCRVNYRDQVGFRKYFSPFTESIYGINGQIGFSRKDRIYISLAGKTHEDLSPPLVKVSGSTNLKTGQYAINITADKVDLKKWGNYVVPFDPLTFKGGEADLVIKLAPPKTAGWPLSLVGNFNFQNASGQIGEYKIEETSGNLSMVDDNLALKDLSLQVNTIPLTVNGRFSDFVKQNLDFNILLKDADLNAIASLFPETRNLDLQGKGDAEFTIKGTATNPQAKGTASIKKGKFFNQDFTGQADISLKQKILKINLAPLRLYKGELSGNCAIDFSKKLPELALSTRLKNIDLTALAQNSPGIVGRANGELTVFGPLNNLKGNLSADLSNAMFFGQSMNHISSAFTIKDGDTYLESFSATSKTASIRSSGLISRDLTFDFQAQAQGIKLSGRGLLGKMEATVGRFQGNVHWKLDDAFFASPLKNLQASGMVKLNNGRIGEQEFELAQGKINMGKGLISIENVTFTRRQSVLRASGQTGIGYPTQLKIHGEKINLKDLKILNHILPQEAKDPTGEVDVAVAITGEIPKETQITSFDPLLDLNASGEVTIYNVNIAEIPITQGQLMFLWKERRLNFPQCSIKTPDSNLSFSMLYEKENIMGSVSGIINFHEFRRLTAKYGKLDGKIGINLIIEGRADAPGFGASFWLEDFSFNRLDFNHIEGSATYSQNRFTFTKAVRILKDSSRFEITGSADLSALQKNQPEESYLDLNIKVIKADLASVIDLSENIQGEFSRRALTPTNGGKVTIDLTAPLLPAIQQFTTRRNVNFYSANGEKEYFLKGWLDIFEQMQKTVAAKPQENMGGDLAGEISLKGKVKNLTGKFSGEVKKGFYRDFTFDSLKANASLADNRINIENLELSKKRGKLSTRGDIGFDNTISLNIAAQDFPLDILRIVFDKEFKGTVNMSASIEGVLQDPQVMAMVTGKDVSLAEVPFDRVSIQVTKKNSNIFIHDFSMFDDNKLSRVYGSLDLSPNGGISLEASLNDNAVGLFNLITDDIKWRKGKASAALKISGTFEKLDINGEIDLKDSTTYVRAIDSEVKDISGKATIKNSEAKIPSLTGIWQGKTSRDYPNPIGLAGSVNLSRILSANRMTSLDLVFTPTRIYADLPNLYSGTIKIKEAQLNGPLYFDFSQGPTLKGKAEINNALITLSQKNKRQEKVFPLNFDLTLNLNKNVYTVMGDIATFDLSNIFMNIEINSPNLIILGNLKYPSPKGKIFLKRGTVTIFNREFSLFRRELQERYYQYAPEKIMENVALFTGEEGEAGLMPEVSIVARVEVENPVTVNGETVIKKVIILSRLQGMIGAAEKERALKITFDSFTEDRTKIPYEIKPAGYSEQEIKVMLLPDFIKSLAGISNGEDAEVDTNVVVADYISSRIQTFVFRGIERELEQKLGLESLTLEYNFGKDVRQAMGVTERRVLEGEKPDWRVGFVKGLFDNLYLDVNYAQFGTDSNAPAEGTFNYQLTYKLSPIWSIIYYREPTSLQELTTGYQKVTLKAGLSFW